MLPLQWVAWGLLLVITDLTVERWDVLADPVGWLVVLYGLSRLRDLGGAQPGPLLGRPVTIAAVVALAVSVLTWPPGLLHDVDPSLSWALSLPEEVFCVLLAFRMALLVPSRARTFSVLGWVSVGVALAPPAVLVLASTTLVVLLAGVAVISAIWLVVALFTSAHLVGRDAAGPPPSGDGPAVRTG